VRNEILPKLKMLPVKGPDSKYLLRRRTKRKQAGGQDWVGYGRGRLTTFLRRPVGAGRRVVVGAMVLIFRAEEKNKTPNLCAHSTTRWSESSRGAKGWGRFCNMKSSKREDICPAVKKGAKLPKRFNWGCSL